MKRRSGDEAFRRSLLAPYVANSEGGVTVEHQERCWESYDIAAPDYDDMLCAEPNVPMSQAFNQSIVGSPL